MNDWELLNFLLECPMVANQVRTSDTVMCAQLSERDNLNTEFFKEIAKTGRDYIISSGRIYFDRSEQNLAIAQ